MYDCPEYLDGIINRNIPFSPGVSFSFNVGVIGGGSLVRTQLSIWAPSWTEIENCA